MDGMENEEMSKDRIAYRELSRDRLGCQDMCRDGMEKRRWVGLGLLLRR